MSKWILVFATLGALILQAGCNTVPKLVEYPPSHEPGDYQRAMSAPIILVGRLVHDSAVEHKFRPSRWDQGLNVNLWRVTVHVENVLRGGVSPDEIDVYYFRYNFVSGPARVGTWQMGDRKIFFLRRDSGVLRTACDGWSSCVIPLLTGFHPGFRTDPDKPIAYSIVDLLLTRGQGCGDKQMIEAISKTGAYLFSMEYTIQRLRQLAMAEGPEIRRQACETLASLGYPCDPSVLKLR